MTRIPPHQFQSQHANPCDVRSFPTTKHPSYGFLHRRWWHIFRNVAPFQSSARCPKTWRSWLGDVGLQPRSLRWGDNQVEPSQQSNESTYIGYIDFLRLRYLGEFINLLYIYYMNSVYIYTHILNVLHVWHIIHILYNTDYILYRICVIHVTNHILYIIRIYIYVHIIIYIHILHIYIYIVHIIHIYIYMYIIHILCYTYFILHKLNDIHYIYIVHIIYT